MSLISSLTHAQMLNEMDQALADEIAKQGNSNSAHHIATDGKLVSDGNGQYIYTFTLDEPWDPQDDAPLRIANARGKEIKCSIITVRGTLITIASDTDLSEDLLQHIDFIDDSTELLKRQREALKLPGQEGAGRLASKSFGLISYQTATIPVEQQLSPCTSLRDQQHRAVSNALGGEVAFIIGPPGTGKTLTLAAIAFMHLQQGRTVLIAAHTNIAIDNAIMNLCKLCKDAGREALLGQGQVVRFGAVQKAELKNDPFYQEVYLPKIVLHLNAQLQQEYDAYTRDLSNIEERISDLLQKQHAEVKKYQRLLDHFKGQMDPLRTTLQQLEAQERHRLVILHKQQKQYLDELQQREQTWIETSQYLAQTKAFIIEQGDAHTNTQRQERDVLRRLLDARAMNSVQRFLHRINLEKLERQVGETTYQANQLLLSIQEAQNDENRYQKQMSTLEPSIKECRERIRRVEQQLNIPSAQATDIIHLQSELTQAERHYQQQKDLLNQAKQLYQPEMQAFSWQKQQLETQRAGVDQQMRDIEKKIVEKARVVGTTLTKTYMNQAVSNRRFDAVILDEVSAAPMPLIYLAATHADHSTTFIGDPQQLAPIAHAETPMVEKWLKKDLFNFRGISLEIANQGSHHSVFLDVQSRMHPQIARVANTLIYQNKLVDAFEEDNLKTISPVPGAPLVLCDTQDAAPTVSRPRNGKSRRNYYHALCCLELAKKVQQQLPDTSIGIITPYAPQARLIQNLVKNAGLQSTVQAGTVHRFQGLEFDTVIFDTVESPGLSPGEFILGSTGSNTMRLVNVAITRARHKLFIVAHLQHILQEFPDTAILKKSVQHAARSAIYPSLDIVGTSIATILHKAHIQQIPHEQILSQLLTKEETLVLYPAKETESEKVRAYNEKTFYDACKQDLFMASESIIIASPFLAPARVKKLLSSLLEKQRQGVQMTIYTKPLHECEAWHGQAAQILLDAGLQLTYRPDMHQKFIILDGKTLYHGGLNMLSQHKSGESMLRLMKQPQIIETLNEELQMLSGAATHQKKSTIIEEDIRNLKTITLSLRLLPALASTCACGSRFVPRIRQDGSNIFYGCENYPRCKHKNTVNVTKDHIQQISILQNKNCVHCHSTLELQFQDKPQIILLSCEDQCKEKQRVIFIR